MHHMPVHPNQEIKRNKTRIRTQQYIQLNTEAKQPIKLNTDGPDLWDDIKPPISKWVWSVIPQSHTVDQPTAAWQRATVH